MDVKLTAHQINAKVGIYDLLSQSKHYALLSGMSGTGKSTTTQEIIKEYVMAHKQVWISATTHKAVEVVSRNTIVKHDRISTIHSFLNLIRDTSQQGAPLIINPRKLDRYTDLLVIDEYSMLTKDVINELKKYMKRNPDTKVLFVGDASQLILDANDLKTFDLSSVTIHLTEPMRQGAYSDLAAYSIMASEFILEKGPEPSIPWGDEIIKYENHKDFIKAWKQSRTKDKAILAFKNVTVNSYNRNISKYHKGQISEYEVGNKVILRSSVTLMGKVISTGMVETIPNRTTIEITGVLEEKDYWIISCERGKFMINKTKSWLDKQTQQFIDDKMWAEYYRVRNKYVQVHHAETITTHSSQGDTFDEVFIDASDMMTAPSDVRRLAYVSISRARHKAHVYIGTGKREYKAFQSSVEDIDSMLV